MRNSKALSISASATILFISILTIAGELSESFLALMKSLTFHHWFTKSVASLIFFFLIYIVTYKTKDKNDPLAQTKLVILATIIATLAISAFFFIHYFVK